MTTMLKERIDMRIDPSIKKLAERASAISGCNSLTEYITSLIKKDAEKVITDQTSIQLTNKQFDDFIKICNRTDIKPDQKLLKAAKDLDQEGF